METVGYCEYCRQPFQKVSPDQLFCKTTHATKARANRRKNKELKKAPPEKILKHRDEANKTQLCPNPYKRSYVNAEHAQMFAQNQRLYRCICGALHYTTKNVRPQDITDPVNKYFLT